MNAVNPIQSPTSPGAGGAEPSMEEILASIRKIIADDGTMPRPDNSSDADRAADEADAERAPVATLQPPHGPSHVPPEAVRQAHELKPHEAFEPDSHDASAHRPLQAPTLRGSDEQEPGIGQDSAAPHAPSSEGPMAETAADLSKHPLAPAPEVIGLGSVVQDEPVLGRSIPNDDGPAQKPPHVPERLVASAVDSSVTAAFNVLAASRFVDNSEQLSGLVGEMIRPLVKAWVDENLPGMVERLVVAEIERMTRGGR